MGTPVPSCPRRGHSLQVCTQPKGPSAHSPAAVLPAAGNALPAHPQVHDPQLRLQGPRPGYALSAVWKNLWKPQILKLQALFMPAMMGMIQLKRRRALQKVGFTLLSEEQRTAAEAHLQVLLPKVVCVGEHKEALRRLHEPLLHLLHTAHLRRHGHISKMQPRLTGQ